MATSKPRITITLDKNIYETITRFAALQGATRSSVINDLLEAVHHPLMQSVALLEAAQGAPEGIRSGMRESVDGLLSDLTEIVDRGTGMTQDMLTMLESISGSEGSSSSSGARTTTPPKTHPKKPRKKAGSNPRVVTRGSGISKPLKSKETGFSQKGVQK